MNRRRFLQLVVGGATATALVPKLPLAALPEPVEPVFDLLPEPVVPAELSHWVSYRFYYTVTPPPQGWRNCYIRLIDNS